MDLRTAIENNRDCLTASDRRLLQELLANPMEGAFLSATALAARAGVHATTAVRLARRLGFAGYPDLRAKLQAEVIDAAEPAARVQRSLVTAGGGSILEALVQTDLAALERLPRMLDQSQIDEAAQMLVGAREVFLFGQGTATSLVTLMERRLRRAGFRVTPLHHRSRQIAERVVSLGAGDVVFAFAFHSVPRGMAPLLEYVAQAGAASVVLTDLSREALSPRPNLVISAERGAGHEEFQSLTVPMAVCNAIVLTISKLDGGASIEGMRKYSNLVRRFLEEPLGAAAKGK